MSVENLFTLAPSSLAVAGNAAEHFETLLDHPAFRLERIVSTGQATAAGEWLSQPRAEWVVLLTGSAAVRFEDELEARSLQPGDVLHIAPNRRHRVERTDATAATVWLALHYDVAIRDGAIHDGEESRP
jgi:cupin 2 domain-containing protein